MINEYKHLRNYPVKKKNEKEKRQQHQQQGVLHCQINLTIETIEK